MKKLEATIEPYHLDEVREALAESGIDGMTISEVRGIDPHAHKAWYRGSEYVVWFTPHIKLEIVLRDDQVDLCVGALLRCTKTNDDASGEIVVLPIEDMIRVRTGEHLARAA